MVNNTVLQTSACTKAYLKTRLPTVPLAVCENGPTLYREGQHHDTHHLSCTPRNLSLYSFPHLPHMHLHSRRRPGEANKTSPTGARPSNTRAIALVGEMNLIPAPAPHALAQWETAPAMGTKLLALVLLPLERMPTDSPGGSSRLLCSAPTVVDTGQKF
jgi:hypothetical protein